MSGEPDMPILELRRVCKSFAKPAGPPSPVLAGIDLVLKPGEILGLLGRSGSGKSTLLRIAAGLMKPTSGEVLYRGKPLQGPSEGLAVVFQTFALFPWLTVKQNVESGLNASGLPHAAMSQRAATAIDLIGLNGFQSAYPRELSGGMRQRVGFARAFVTQPTLLLMDEPFSALDVLTAETLRTDFIDLRTQKQLATQSVLIVTHNIEEAVMLCDRIVVLAAPGRIAADLAIALPHPRDRLDPAFHAIVDEIYCTLTARAPDALRSDAATHDSRARPLPAASPVQMAGQVDTVAARPSKAPPSCVRGPTAQPQLGPDPAAGRSAANA